MPICTVVKQLPLGTVDDLLHYCTQPSASCNSASGRPRHLGVIVLTKPQTGMKTLYTRNQYMDTVTNSVDPDEMMHSAASDLGLHFFQRHYVLLAMYLVSKILFLYVYNLCPVYNFKSIKTLSCLPGLNK